MILSIIPHSFAWDGSMAMDGSKRNIELGEIINYEGYLYGSNPLENEFVYVTVFETVTGKTVLEFNLTPSKETVDYFENTAWTFSFEIDTRQGFLDNKEYTVLAKYDDKKTNLNFLIKEADSKLEEKVTDAGEALVDAGTETGELIIEAGKEAEKVIVQKGEEAITEAKEFDEKNKEQRQEFADKVEEKGSEIIQEIEETAGGGCLIATAAHGSELSPQVQILREIRDNKLLQTQTGSTFVKTFNEFYYIFSPTVADYERENPLFKEMIKITITPMISSLSILNYVELNSDYDVLVYGVSLILLNLGIYVGVPIGVFLAVKRDFVKN